MFTSYFHMVVVLFLHIATSTALISSDLTVRHELCEMVSAWPLHKVGGHMVADKVLSGSEVLAAQSIPLASSTCNLTPWPSDCSKRPPKPKRTPPSLPESTSVGKRQGVVPELMPARCVMPPLCMLGDPVVQSDDSFQCQTEPRFVLPCVAPALGGKVDDARENLVPNFPDTWSFQQYLQDHPELISCDASQIVRHNKSGDTFAHLLARDERYKELWMLVNNGTIFHANRFGITVPELVAVQKCSGECLRKISELHCRWMYCEKCALVATMRARTADGFGPVITGVSAQRFASELGVFNRCHEAPGKK